MVEAGVCSRAHRKNAECGQILRLAVLRPVIVLWIGSSQCESGETYKKAQATGGSNYGCLTMFNTSTNAVTLDSYKGDATGIASVSGLDKVYTAEGGQVFIYNTADMSERDNSNVEVTGTASDVAYMDAPSDANNTDY